MANINQLLRDHHTFLDQLADWRANVLSDIEAADKKARDDAFTLLGNEATRDIDPNSGAAGLAQDLLKDTLDWLNRQTKDRLSLPGTTVQYENGVISVQREGDAAYALGQWGETLGAIEAKLARVKDVVGLAPEEPNADVESDIPGWAGFVQRPLRRYLSGRGATRIEDAKSEVDARLDSLLPGFKGDVTERSGQIEQSVRRVVNEYYLAARAASERRTERAEEARKKALRGFQQPLSLFVGTTVFDRVQTDLAVGRLMRTVSPQGASHIVWLDEGSRQ